MPRASKPKPERRCVVRLEHPFTTASLLELIRNAQSPTSPNSHEQIADWCWRFYWECQEGVLVDVDDDRLNRAADVALDVDAQWDLYLVNTFSLDELTELDLATVRLPAEWWCDWESELMHLPTGKARS